ncbi:MAG: phosphatase [Clostridiales bacterium]|nr:phosphatase [Clostridiales bacterium]
MICGIVDVGSNTIHLSIYRCDEEGSQLMMHQKVMAGLASYVEGGKLTEEGIRVVCHVLSDYRALLDNLKISSVYVFATASMRNISNADDVRVAIRTESGLDVDRISGEDEAALSFYGALMDIPHDDGVLVDLGGGSTELVQYEDRTIRSACSLSVGALNLFNRYVAGLHPTKEECRLIRNEVQEQLAREQKELRLAEHICGVGGTARAACRVANRFFGRAEDCRVLTAREIRQLLKRFRGMDRETMRVILKLAPERIHTLVPGLVVLDTICQLCGAQDITVSTRGIREGYLHRRVLKEE